MSYPFQSADWVKLETTGWWTSFDGTEHEAASNLVLNAMRSDDDDTGSDAGSEQEEHPTVERTKSNVYIPGNTSTSCKRRACINKASSQRSRVKRRKCVKSVVKGNSFKADIRTADNDDNHPAKDTPPCDPPEETRTSDPLSNFALKPRGVPCDTVRDSECASDGSNWADDPGQVPADPGFHEEAGMKCKFPENITIRSVTDMLLTDDFFQLVTNQTNAYKRWCESRNISGMFLRNFRPVTVPEMRVFFAIAMHMGVVQKPEVIHYWSTKKFLATSFASDQMSHFRFVAIYWMLHLSNNDHYAPVGHPDHDPLYKIMPAADLLRRAFGDVFAPTREVIATELLHADSDSFLLHNASTPQKFHVGLWLLRDAVTGYCFHFDIFYRARQEQTAGEYRAVVMKLMESYLDKGYVVYLNKILTSASLLNELYERRTLATGTCTLTTDSLPRRLVTRSLQNGEVYAARSRCLLALRWKEKENMVLLSTRADDSGRDVVTDGVAGRVTKKPVAWCDYDEQIARANRFEQHLRYCPFKESKIKWWKILFFRLFNLGVSNAYIIYNHLKVRAGGKRSNMTDFLADLAQSYVLADSDRVHGNESNVRKNSGVHFPKLLPLRSDGTRRRGSDVCRRCATLTAAKVAKREVSPETRISRTFYKCSVCQVPLCLTPCFELYHAHEDESFEEVV